MTDQPENARQGKAVVRKFLQYFFTTLRILAALFSAFLIITALLWVSPSFVFLFAMLTVAILWPARRINQGWRKAYLVVLVSLGVLFIASSIIGRHPLGEIDERMKSLHVKSYSDPHSLSTFDQLTIWCGNIAMGLIGYPVFPEVAWETLSEALPGPETHLVESDFAMKSHKVRQTLSEFAKSLPDSGQSKEIKQKKIWWDDYNLESYGEIRVALAVNCPFYIDATAKREQDRWRIEASGTCRVEYGHLKEITAIKWGKYEFLGISATMVWALQKVGWMHPFTVTYHWVFYDDDKRLR